MACNEKRPESKQLGDQVEPQPQVFDTLMPIMRVELISPAIIDLENQGARCGDLDSMSQVFIIKELRPFIHTSINQCRIEIQRLKLAGRLTTNGAVEFDKSYVLLSGCEAMEDTIALPRDIRKAYFEAFTQIEGCAISDGESFSFQPSGTIIAVVSDVLGSGTE